MARTTSWKYGTTLAKETTNDIAFNQIPTAVISQDHVSTDATMGTTKGQQTDEWKITGFDFTSIPTDSDVRIYALQYRSDAHVSTTDLGRLEFRLEHSTKGYSTQHIAPSLTRTANDQTWVSESLGGGGAANGGYDRSAYLTRSEVTDSSFGLLFQYQQTEGTAHTLYIDALQLICYYEFQLNEYSGLETATTTDHDVEGFEEHRAPPKGRFIIGEDGDEMTVNGDFNSPNAEWSLNTGCTYDSTNEEMDWDGTQTASGGATQFGAPLTPKTLYRITWNVTARSAGQHRVVIGTNQATSWYTTTGVHTAYLRAPEGAGWYLTIPLGRSIAVQGDADFIGSVTSVSVVQVAGPTELAPTWSTTDHAIVEVPKGTLSVTEAAPTWSTTDPAIVEVPKGTLSVTEAAPTWSTTDHQDVTIPAGAVTATGQQPTVELPVTVEVPAGSITITEAQPSVVLHVDTEIPAGAVSITEHQPSVVLHVDTEVPAGQVTVTGQQPTVDISDHQEFTIPAGDITTTGYAPVPITTLDPEIVSIVPDAFDDGVPGIVITVQNLNTAAATVDIDGEAQLITNRTANTLTITTERGTNSLGAGTLRVVE